MPLRFAEDPDPRFVAGPSTLPGAGRGLFAAVPLAAGEALDVAGVLIDADSTADDWTRYADAYKFRVGAQLLIPLGRAALVNHSADLPNLEKVIDGERVVLRTLRAIAAGEELFFRYAPRARVWQPE